MTKKKRVRIVIAAVLILLLLIPVHVRMTDGGSEGWYAVLWQMTRCHELTDQGLLNADCKKDNKRDMDDAMMILQFIAKIIPYSKLGA